MWNYAFALNFKMRLTHSLGYITQESNTSQPSFFNFQQGLIGWCTFVTCSYIKVIDFNFFLLLGDFLRYSLHHPINRIRKRLRCIIKQTMPCSLIQLQCLILWFTSTVIVERLTQFTISDKVLFSMTYQNRRSQFLRLFLDRRGSSQHLIAGA